MGLQQTINDKGQTYFTSVHYGNAHVIDILPSSEYVYNYE